MFCITIYAQLALGPSVSHLFPVPSRWEGLMDRVGRTDFSMVGFDMSGLKMSSIKVCSRTGYGVIQPS